MSTYEKVKDVIEKKVNPALALDGGNVELVSVENGTVNIKMGGGCAGCPMRQFTLSTFIQTTITKEVPEIKKVVAV